MYKRLWPLLLIFLNPACGQANSNFVGSQSQGSRSVAMKPSSSSPSTNVHVHNHTRSFEAKAVEQDIDSDDSNTDSVTDISNDPSPVSDPEPEIVVERALEHVGVSSCASLDETSDSPGIYSVVDGPKLNPEPDLTERVVMTSGNSIYRADDRHFGRVVGHVGNGSWCLVSPLGANGGTIITNQDGKFNQIIPVFCGDQILKLTWPGVGNQTIVATTKISRTDCVSEANGMRVTLSWGPEADDLEAHLIRQGGRINNHDGSKNDCTWTSCVKTSPDWGVKGDRSDNPTKDSDWRGNNGLENIVLPKLEPVSYDVMVEYWRVGQPTSARVVINVMGKASFLTVPALKTHEVWHVARIDGASGEVTVIDEIIECASNWGSGCRKAIP